MTDLQALIAERKAKLAALQRRNASVKPYDSAHLPERALALDLDTDSRPGLGHTVTQAPIPARDTTAVDHSRGLRVTYGELIRADAPFYSKTTQTEPIRVRSRSTIAVVSEIGQQAPPDSSTILPSDDDDSGISPDSEVRLNAKAAKEPFVVKPPSDESTDLKNLAEFLDDAWRALSRACIGAQPLKQFRTRPPEADEHAVVVQSVLHTKPATVVSCSSHFSELLALTAGNNVAEVWSLDAPNGPEFVVRAATTITVVLWSLDRPTTLFGGGANGQIMRWELEGMRMGILPVLRSPLDGLGHVSEVITDIAWAAPGTLVSVDASGVVCIWSPDLLVRPQRRVVVGGCLSHVAATRLNVVVGSLGGELRIVDLRTDDDPEVATVDRPHHFNGISGHEGPVVAMRFRPQRQATDDAWLLSAGTDWTLRLWWVPAGSGGIHLAADIVVDSVIFDLAWSPSHPAVFAAATESGLQIWDLLRSTASPTCSWTGGPLRSISWRGQRVIAGSKDGATCFAMPEFPFLETQWHAFDTKFKPII